MNEDMYMTLSFDNGEEEECLIIGVFEVDGKEYIALDPENEDDDIYLYGYKEISEEEFELLDIEDDAEFESVSEEFARLMEQIAE
ncbi:MAG: DUF1292 domain-containing protein [Eubacterium sp.]|nr:DUF1292 domain-containing protein [Eubacterium sp.]